MTSETSIVFAPFRLDTLNQCLWRGARAIPLTPKTFAVLRYLVERPGQLVTKEELLNAVWPGTYVSDAALKVCIRRLRTVLGDQPHAARFIETAHWRGYRFIGKISRMDEAAHSPGHGAPGLKKSAPQISSAEDGAAEAAPASLWQPSSLPVIGRETEIAQLQRWLEKARQGKRQTVFITGEPGIGKTTVIETFLTHALKDPNLWVARGQCVEHYGAGEAYLPVLEALDRLGRTPRREQLAFVLGQYAPTWLAQLPALLSTDGKRPRRLPQGASQERMLREIAQALEALTTRTPLILILEDLQWSDYATLDLLAFLARRPEPARLLLLGTYQPAELVIRGHPLRGVKQDLQNHRQCEELPLTLLSEAAVRAYVQARCPGMPVLTTLAHLIHQRTDGNPLFMVNVLAHLLAQGVIVQRDGRWDLGCKIETLHIEVPASIQQLLDTQMDRLSPEAQRILEIASVAGAEFSAAEVAAGAGTEIAVVEEICQELVRRGQFLRAHGSSHWPDGTVAAQYGFTHWLYQQAWYARVTVGRRVSLHRRIAERVEDAYGQQGDHIAAQLAVHFEHGRDYGRAVRYRQRAAETALRRCAYRETSVHLSKGLELLHFLPDTPERTQQEIVLQSLLGTTLVATEGYAAPAVERAYARARTLCQQAEDHPQFFCILRGLWEFYTVRAEFDTVRELENMLLHLAQSKDDPALLLETMRAVGQTAYLLGEFQQAREYLTQCLALYDPQQHRAHGFLYGQDPGVIGLAYMARVLWLLGYPDQALQRSEAALALARQQSHPYSLALAFYHAAVVQQCRRNSHATRALAEAAISLSSEQGFPYALAAGTMLRGWAIAMQGQEEEGIAQIRQGLAAYQATGAEVARPYCLTLLGQVLGKAGRAEEGLAAVADALVVSREKGPRFYQAEHYRLRGELLLQSGIASPGTTLHKEAEEYFHQAIDLARRQSAKSLELRATMSLSRLWRDQGKAAAAHRLLSDVYNWFSEGLDTADLQDAKALLDELA